MFGRGVNINHDTFFIRIYTFFFCLCKSSINIFLQFVGSRLASPCGVLGSKNLAIGEQVTSYGKRKALPSGKDSFNIPTQYHFCSNMRNTMIHCFDDLGINPIRLLAVSILNLLQKLCDLLDALSVVERSECFYIFQQERYGFCSLMTLST